MKRTRILALVLTAALMLTGVGYALWSETLTIQATAQTGDFNVDFVDIYNKYDPCDFRAYAEIDELTGMVYGKDGRQELIKNYLTHNPPDDPKDEPPLDWNDARHDKDNLDFIYFEVGNLYPGAVFTLSYKVKNNGSVPVRLEDFYYEPVADAGNILGLLTIKTSGVKTTYLEPDGEAILTTTVSVPSTWTDKEHTDVTCIFKLFLDWQQAPVRPDPANATPAV